MRSNRPKAIQPIIPPKSFLMILSSRSEKNLSLQSLQYSHRIIDYKYCGLLQRYIGLGGKILPRRQTRLSAKQQRYLAKTIKSARIMGLLPFVSKEKGFFR
jgi:ribosomal protein S18